MRLPEHSGSDLPNLMIEIDRMKEKYSFPGVGDKIAKITFICGCHGNIISSFRDFDTNGKIPKGGIFENTQRQVSSNLFKNKVMYTKDKPIIEFEYTEIDTSHLNVSLSTTTTCFGASTYRTRDSAKIKQKFVNDVMEELTTTCPTNTMIEDLGEYGDTVRVKHKDYFQYRRQTTARKIQNFVRKTRRTPDKTVLMTYEKEKVNSLANKVYSIFLKDVSAAELYHPSLEFDEVELELTPTDCDAHKLIMIVTKYTSEGCVSEKYVLLAHPYELEVTELKMEEQLSPSIATFYKSILKPINTGEIILGIKTDTPSYFIRLNDLISLANKIIQDMNGDVLTPIDFYDLSCNSFIGMNEVYKDMYKRRLTAKELAIVRFIDNYIREKDVAYGRKRIKKKR